MFATGTPSDSHSLSAVPRLMYRRLVRAAFVAVAVTFAAATAHAAVSVDGVGSASSRACVGFI
jgi:hypothetical protein